ncbi:XRE family transcriptional regulator [Streptococcus suis]|uniref:Phage transcriptional repressor n=1 Tax=Streptococcus suis TaxID=1307 RepID=A0A0Z8M9D6_STRSU|nr:XRE family transcriptional regulator [Streptococcus suis]NQG60075.1 LexA family transcriptional regulator [Streptococcus suis]NQH17923.1 LexA family transcriptional regulator [Streptococcus suis]NQN65279.1 LexA family transcriptional regulator [Streptococcus suis]NQN69961.1 LexA family transcriptional regulator [Streptococcus suis]NQN71989.1 LexA family transcriptional regulator [Streptococcus suis]
MKNILGNSIRELRKSKKMTQVELAKKTGYKQNTISNHENGNRQLDEQDILKYAKALEVEPQVLFDLSRTPTTAPNSLVEQISDKVVQLSTEGQKSVLHFTSELLEREEADRIVQEEPLFKIYFSSATKAGPKGYGYDDYDADYAYTNQEPPRHDIATQVDGNSMNPDYQDGDILYLRDYGASHYNGEECVVVIDDKSYFKRLYTTEDGLRLVSTNPDKDTYPDLYIEFPPTDGSHIKIFNVVGSFTPVER